MSSFEGSDITELWEGVASFSPVDLDSMRLASVFPTIELDSVINATMCKPFREALGDTELD
jgi:hypothetical protein